MASNYLQQVTAVIDTSSAFGTTLKQLKDNVTTLQTQMSTLLADAPETLDTLNEIAAAISDDPAFFTTMATANTTLQSNIDALTTAAANARAALQTALESDIALRATIATPTFTGHTFSPEYRAAGSGHLKLRAEVGNDLNIYLADQETLQITRSGTDCRFTSNGGTGTFKFNQETDFAGGVKLAGTAVTATAAEINAFDGRLDTLEADPTTKAYVDTAVSNLVDAAPGVLDTLNELAAAIDDDANFATTITSSIAAVQADVDQNETDADAAIAAVQADVDQNESDADAAIAALQADVDQNETDADAAIAALQADVDQNESDADAALATKLDLAGGTLTGSLIVQRQFPDFELKSNEEKRLLFTDAGGGATGAIKNVDSELDFFAGGVTAADKVMSVASDGVDVSALKIDGTAVTSTATELNQLDGVTLGTAATAATGDFATAAQGVKADSALQSHQDISGKANLSGATFTGNVEVSKSFPDITLKSGDEKRFLFSDAGGAATGGIKHVSSSLDFYAGGIASGNKELVVSSTGVEVLANLTLSGGLTDAANDSAADSAGVAVGQLYRNGSVVMIRVS